MNNYLTISYNLFFSSWILLVNSCAVYLAAFYFSQLTAVQRRKFALLISVLLLWILCSFSLEGLKKVDFYWYAFHDIIGLSFVIFPLTYLPKEIKLSNIMKGLLAFPDKYSYHIYLTHQIFIFGALSVIEITAFLPLNICILFFVINISAFLLFKLSSSLQQSIIKSTSSSLLPIRDNL